MAQPLKLSLQFAPEIDEAKLEKLKKVLTDAIETGTEINFDEPAIKEALTEINKLIDSTLNDIVLDANIDDVIQAIATVSDALDEIASQNSSLEIDADAEQAMKSIDELSNEFEKVKKDAAAAFSQQQRLIAAMVAAGQEGTPEFEQAVNEAKDLRTVLEGIAVAEKKATEAAFGIGEGISETLENIDDNTEALTLGAALDHISAGFGALVEKGEEYNNSLRKLSATTGATGDELKQLEEDAKTVFVSGVGESASQALEIMGEAKLTLGKVFTGEELTEATVEFGKIGQSFGKEFGEIAGKAAGFSKTFGVDGKESADLIAFAMQKGKTAADNTLDVIGEFTPLMKQAGFTAAEFVGILNTGSEAGIADQAKLADAIKETGNRIKNGDIKNEMTSLITDMGDRFPEALQKTLDGIASAAQSGQINTKETLEQSTKAIEEQFKAGNIDGVMRAKLQSVFAGSPAEEIGGEMYAKIFNAPIDDTAIKAKAAAANAVIQQSMGNQTLADKFSKQFTIIEEKAASALLPLSKGIAGAASVAPQLLAIKQFLPEKSVEAITGKFKDMAGMAGKLKGALGGAEGLLNPTTIGIAAGIAALTYFFTQTDKGKEIFASLEKKWDDFYAKAKPVLVAVGGLLETLIGGIIGNVVAEIEAMGSIIGEVFSVLGDLAKEVAAFFGLTGGDGDTGAAFTDMASAVNNLGVIADAVFAGIQAVIAGVAEVIKKLIHLDFSGAAEAASNIGTNMGKAMKDKAESEMKKLKLEGLQNQIAAGLEVKDSLDKNGEIKKLVAEYKSATDEVQKQNLADQIAKQVPGAVAGMKTTVDAATGKVKESYDIALDKAEEFANNQGAVLEKQVEASKGAFVAMLQDQVNTLEESKKKLAELATKTVSAKTPEEQAAALKAYDEEKKKIEEQSKAIAGTVAQGKGLGIAAKNLEEMGKQAGLSGEEAAKLAGVMDKVQKETKKATFETGALAKAYNDANTAASNMQSSARQAAVQTASNILKLRESMRAASDPAERERIRQEIKDNEAAQKANIEKGKAATKELNRVAEAEKLIQTKTGELARTRLEVAQNNIALTGAQLDLDLQAYQLLQENTILQQKRERTAADDYALAQKELDVSNEKLRIATEQLKIGGLTKEKQEQVIGAIRQQVRELGKVDLNALAPKIGLNFDESRDEKFTKAIEQQLAAAVLDAETKNLNVVNLRAQLTIGFDEITSLQHDLDKRAIEFDISIGVKDDRALAEFISEDLEKAQAKLTEGGLRLQAIEQQLANAKTESDRAILQAQIAEQLKANLEQKGAVLDLQQQVNDSWRSYYDKQAAEVERQSTMELEAQAKLFDKRSALIDRALTLENDLRVAHAEESNGSYVALLDEQAAEQSEILDKQAANEMETLDSMHELGLVSELEYLSQKADLEAQAEERRKAEAERAQKAKEEAERLHQENLTRIAAEETGKRLLLETEKVRQELTAQKKALAEQYRLAKQKAQLPDASLADKQAAEVLSKQLDDVSTTLEEKGSIIGVLAEQVGGSLQDAVAGMFDGNEEVMADSFRKLFSTLSGALKQLASSFVIDIVLQSPYVKSAIALNPLIGAGITAGVTGLLRGLTNALLSPVLDGLLSFSSGGAVTTPTLAMIGDASKLGGMNKEWIMRDEHIWKIAYGAGKAATEGLSAKMDVLIEAVQNIGGEWTLKGQDLRMAVRRAESAALGRLM